MIKFEVTGFNGQGMDGKTTHMEIYATAQIGFISMNANVPLDAEQHGLQGKTLEQIFEIANQEFMKQLQQGVDE
ncbi:hypothetical protein [Enterococcus cecorum]|uniref:hypothetical protein n=1 Tax=Enterococcus cecorum TaxID=44008 RepID=UPI001FAB5CBA|nr:hypothetical protein [Enterococcus cecorum]MCJ0567156.1 hypothetical protein [Enterococcus cecorum]MCJ0595923.1 hypothetical protein [Enterococcus cecorum]MCJ0600084.1 hypothetical protein [Enterococcus cecorum]MCJ0604111.1 hypothetical protein [Enterococcus cecorum]MDZ5509508.1 hypothetical protein [Enterococcus cecorum]